jgi:hypothetical protein
LNGSYDQFLCERFACCWKSRCFSPGRVNAVPGKQQAMRLCTLLPGTHNSARLAMNKWRKVFNIDVLSHAFADFAQFIDVINRTEILNIGNLVQNIRKNFTSHSRQAVITASKDMRIDGERIHMG